MSEHFKTDDYTAGLLEKREVVNHAAPTLTDYYNYDNCSVIKGDVKDYRPSDYCLTKQYEDE